MQIRAQTILPLLSSIPPPTPRTWLPIPKSPCLASGETSTSKWTSYFAAV
ncbi:uncharacterized protein LACBIDRAFT_316914 [Laccaria bicolor S238N-H82]|uniref:Predicted protein n=1 Tax=Laccaria bicolor (strain S238N-H82 / ATCC MYA-4686) TaxID=486041 RepID=B0D597_LACBS|nr:uncharacterized protein LACBIDRAFT_316914 [Laccaria bicolor S238N-H82]EDR10480.1 predicted protein [Laccaria bicolor S238N-H82]|eukprot:XP_001878930.1 predicted protein [Laccaria bicolor S238N-H82]